MTGHEPQPCGHEPWSCPACCAVCGKPVLWVAGVRYRHADEQPTAAESVILERVRLLAGGVL